MRPDRAVPRIPGSSSRAILPRPRAVLAWLGGLCISYAGSAYDYELAALVSSLRLG